MTEHSSTRAPTRLTPFGPDIDHSPFDPRPRKRGRKAALTPAEVNLVAVLETQERAYSAMKEAEATWQAATSAAVAAKRMVEAEKQDRAQHLAWVKSQLLPQESAE